MISAAGTMSSRGDHSAIGTTSGDEGTRGTTVALRVLVVEDDAIIGALLAEMLEGMGHDVCAVEATKADMVTAVAQWRPDPMIVDVRLDEGSGGFRRRRNPPHRAGSARVCQCRHRKASSAPTRRGDHLEALP